MHTLGHLEQLLVAPDAVRLDQAGVVDDVLVRLLHVEVAQVAQVALLEDLEPVRLWREIDHLPDQAVQVAALLVAVAGEVQREAVAAVEERGVQTRQLGAVDKLSDRVEEKVRVPVKPTFEINRYSIQKISHSGKGAVEWAGVNQRVPEVQVDAALGQQKLVVLFEPQAVKGTFGDHFRCPSLFTLQRVQFKLFRNESVLFWQFEAHQRFLFSLPQFRHQILASLEAAVLGAVPRIHQVRCTWIINHNNNPVLNNS